MTPPVIWCRAMFFALHQHLKHDDEERISAFRHRHNGPWWPEPTLFNVRKIWEVKR